MATRAGCASARAYLATLLSFTENSSAFVAPIAVFIYRNITINFKKSKVFPEYSFFCTPFEDVILNAMFRQLIFIGIGGGIGSMLRYLVQWSVSRHVTMVFPMGTFLVNITGCFLIGLFYALASRNNMLNFEWRLFLITGLCGGYTTFSSFSYENIALLKNGHYLQFLLYTGLSIFAGLLCTIGGMAAGK